MKSEFDYEYISSKNNEKVKLFSKLSLAKYRNENRLFLAEGIKLTSEALSAGLCKYILVRDGGLDNSEIKRLLKRSEIRSETEIIILSESAFAKVTTEAAPQGVISVVKFPDFHTTDDRLSPDSLDGKRCVALDSVRDPGNLGAIIRSALAFGFDSVIIGSCADIYNTKTVRASMGSVFHENIVVCENLSRFLKRAGESRRILGAALRDDCMALGEYEMTGSDILVIGNEGSGITDEVMKVCDGYVKIPMNMLSESLNAAVAASVLMWEYSKLPKLS